MNSDNYRSPGLEYTLAEDGRYYPNVTVGMPHRNYGKYGSLHREWLKKYNGGLYTDMLSKMTLNDYLADIDQKTRDAVEDMVAQMMQNATDVPDQKSDTIKYIAYEDRMRKAAEEILLPDMIYS